jgi:hypothetical protein
MVSSGMLCFMALLRADVSEERSAFFIRVTRIGELGTTLAVTSNRRTLRRNTLVFLHTRRLHSSECSLYVYPRISLACDHDVNIDFVPRLQNCFVSVLTLKNSVFCDVTPCGCCNNRRFGGTCRLIIRVKRINELRETLGVTSSS